MYWLTCTEYNSQACTDSNSTATKNRKNHHDLISSCTIFNSESTFNNSTMTIIMTFILTVILSVQVESAVICLKSLPI